MTKKWDVCWSDMHSVQSYESSEYFDHIVIFRHIFQLHDG